MKPINAVGTCSKCGSRLRGENYRYYCKLQDDGFYDEPCSEVDGNNCPLKKGEK